MNAPSDTLRPYVDGFNALEASAGNVPGWLAHLRRDAFARFTERGFPGEREEDWKYTQVRSLEKRAFILDRSVPSPISADVIAPALYPGPLLKTLVFVNGQPVPALTSPQSEIRGLKLLSLEVALQQDPMNLQLLLPPDTLWNHDPFTALNTAFLKDGLVIQIEANTQYDHPLQLIFVSTQQSKANACHPRILVQLGQSSRLQLIETYVGLEGAENFTNSYTQIVLAKDAQLEHLRLQRESIDDFHVSRVSVRQLSNSRYISHTLNLGGHWIRTDLHVVLEALGAQTILNGLYAVSDRQHVDNHTRIDHLAPDSHSQELYRGIIDGHGRAVFNGKVVVAENAVRINAAQTNNNLLLSRQAEIDTKPELEIHADDVQCSHGASIGQLDDEALFYLRSRGLDVKMARDLLVEAFAIAVLERIEGLELRDFARWQLVKSLRQSTVIQTP